MVGERGLCRDYDDLANTLANSTATTRTLPVVFWLVREQRETGAVRLLRYVEENSRGQGDEGDEGVEGVEGKERWEKGFDHREKEQRVRRTLSLLPYTHGAAHSCTYTARAATCRR